MARANFTIGPDLTIDAKPPINYTSETPDSDESSCLLSEKKNPILLPSHFSGLTNDSVSYLTDKFNSCQISKPKVNKFDLHQQQNVYDNCFTCPVCYKKKQKFFCPNCVRNGDFTHSKTNFLERFADKKLKFIKLKGHQIQTSSQVQKHFSNSTLKDDLNLQIRKTERNVHLLRKVIAEKNNCLKDLNTNLNEIKRTSLNLKKKHMELKNRINAVKVLVARQTVALNERLRQKVTIENDIQLLLREKMSSLTAYIYQLSEENVTSMDDSIEKCDLSGSGSETTPLLSFSSDSSPNSSIVKETKTPSMVLTKYKIVEPWIYSNENYNSFFTQPNRLEYFDMRENNFRNDQYRVTSALSYLCHLTNLIAIFCDIHLPKKLLFSEFYFKELKKDDFLSKIAKLNANILFLCIYHRIDPNLLHPKHSFRNIQLLLNCPNYVGILSDHNTDISNNFYKIVQDNLVCDLTEKEDFDDSNDEHEENDYHFVENNIPDLNFSLEPIEQSTGTNILSFVSSFYKHLPIGQK